MENYQNFLEWVRYTLMIASIIVALGLFIGAVRYWKRLGIGQRLWSTGAIMALVYMADANHEAAVLDLPFRWRIIPACLALIAYVAYLLEPSGRKSIRFGRDPYEPG